MKSENHGIPQTRHRVILLGIRKDLNVFPGHLNSEKMIPTQKAIGDLPKLRSGLSREEDSGRLWVQAIRAISKTAWFKNMGPRSKIKAEILRATR